MAKAKGESSQGLVVALVFFILTSIALGVTTYLGYSQQDGVDAKIKDAESKATAMKASRDWFKWQAMCYRAAMGYLTLKDPQEFATIRKQFMDGQLGQTAEDRDDVTKLIKDILEGKNGFVFDATTNKYKKHYGNLVEEAIAERDRVIAENDTLRKAKADLETAVGNKDKQIAKQKDDFDKELEKLKETNLATKNTQDNDKVALANEVKRLGQAQADLLNAAAEEKKKLTADLKRALDTVADQKRALVLNSEELLNLKSKASGTAVKGLRSDWKIATIQGNLPYINLGSADGVKTQLTFNIHGVGPDGVPNSKVKGTLEVVRVIDAHLSQARITEVKDPNRDPVLVGDVLNNSTWDPFVKKHVAIAGYIDLYGDGRDGLPELLRTLERQNVIVDAYLDLKDFSVKGALTLQTDYLILGEGADNLPLAVRERDGFGRKLSKGIEDMQADAKKNGIPAMGWRKYLDSIGYKMPRPTGNP